MPFFLGQFYVSVISIAGSHVTRRIFPSKMTAYGFKRAGSADNMAAGHPFGTHFLSESVSRYVSYRILKGVLESLETWLA